MVTCVWFLALSHQILQAMLWLLFAALALYSLIVLTLLILKMVNKFELQLLLNNHALKTSV